MRGWRTDSVNFFPFLRCQAFRVAGAETGHMIHSQERRGICLSKNSVPPSISEFSRQLFATTEHQEKNIGGNLMHWYILDQITSLCAGGKT